MDQRPLGRGTGDNVAVGIHARDGQIRDGVGLRYRYPASRLRQSHQKPGLDHELVDEGLELHEPHRRVPVGRQRALSIGVVGTQPRARIVDLEQHVEALFPAVAMDLLLGHPHREALIPRFRESRRRIYTDKKSECSRDSQGDHPEPPDGFQ